jgi:bacterioferritin-associated ferredoxin
MYVCVCHAVTERDVCSAVTAGCRSLQELRRQLDFGSCCGRCHAYTNGVFQQCLRAQASIRPIARAQLAGA